MVTFGIIFWTWQARLPLRWLQPAFSNVGCETESRLKVTFQGEIVNLAVPAMYGGGDEKLYYRTINRYNECR